MSHGIPDLATDRDIDTHLLQNQCRNDAIQADNYLNAKSLSAAHKRNAQLLKIPASTSVRGNKSEKKWKGNNEAQMLLENTLSR